jgi:hypothetical protein
MLRIVERLRVMAVTTPPRAPEMRVISEDSMATSVPVPALVLEAAYLECLVFREDLGEDAFDADLACDRGSGAGVVAGDHGDGDAQSP